MTDAPNPWLMTERTTLASLDGTRWKGAGELWLDPHGNDAVHHECSAVLESNTLRYAWDKDGRQHEGRVSWTADGPSFSDTFHQDGDVACAPLESHAAEVALTYEYDPGVGPPWGWRIVLSVRPTGQLILQMQNIAPWGEEARAARMIFERSDGV